MPYPKAEEKGDRAEIKITPLSKKILEKPDIIEQILTPEENAFISILMRCGPCTTKELRNQFILLVGRKIIPKIVIKEPVSPFSSSPNSLATLPQKYTNEDIKYYEKILKEKGKKIPSWEKIDGLLLSLERLGIVARRYDPFKKAKWLWILNPDFLIAFKNPLITFKKPIDLHDLHSS